VTATPRVLLLGGIDPSGGAGLTLDALVIAAHGGQPLPVPVVLTAQNRHGFRGAFAVPEKQWRAAFDAACGDGEVHAIKIGLLGAASTIVAVAAALRPFAERVPIVLDPVLSATAGGLEFDGGVTAAYREHLVPLASVVTPNLPETEALFEGDAASALRLGARAVLVKGGHGEGQEAIDTVTTADGEHQFLRARLDIGPVRGTGCALASAIAVRLARGEDLVTACRDAGDWLAERLAQLGPPPAADGLPRTLPRVLRR